MIDEQYKSDLIFTGIFNDGDHYQLRTFKDDVNKIIDLVLNNFNIKLSSSEAVYFWEWRSNQYDASWLSIIDDGEIKKWFGEFLERHKDWWEDEVA